MTGSRPPAVFFAKTCHVTATCYDCPEMDMSNLVKTARRPVAENLNLLVAVLAIIGSTVGSMAWMTGSLRNEMSSFRGEVNARFDAVDIRFNGIDGRLDRVDDRLDRVENRLERIDGQLFDLNGRLIRVESGVFGNAPPASPESPPGDGAVPEPDPVANL